MMIDLYSKEVLVALHDACELLLDGKHRGVSGICIALKNLSYDRVTPVSELFNTIAKQWPDYSDNSTYVVPHPRSNAKYAEQEVYNQGHTSGFYSGEYGALRLDLLQFVVDELEENWIDYVESK